MHQWEYRKEEQVSGSSQVIHSQISSWIKHRKLLEWNLISRESWLIAGGGVLEVDHSQVAEGSTWHSYIPKWDIEFLDIESW